MLIQCCLKGIHLTPVFRVCHVMCFQPIQIFRRIARLVRLLCGVCLAIRRYAVDAGLLDNYMVQVSRKAHTKDGEESEEELNFDIKDFKLHREVSMCFISIMHTVKYWYAKTKLSTTKPCAYATVVLYVLMFADQESALIQWHGSTLAADDWVLWSSPAPVSRACFIHSFIVSRSPRSLHGAKTT